MPLNAFTSLSRGPQSGSVMRLRGRTLATPVLWYRHETAGGTLTLILNNHIGAAAYYTTMARRIGELEARGAAVHWEGVCDAPEQAWATATPAERAARQVMITLYRDQPAALARSLGWVTQKAGLPIGAGWTNDDLTDLDIIRAAGPGAFLAMGAAMDAELAKLGDRRDAYLAAIGPLTLRALARPHAPLSRAITQLAPDVYAVLLERRSKLAAAAADPRRDTVKIWGAEHADSLAAELTAAGWVPTGRRRWLTVGQLPPLRRSLAGLAGVAGGVGADTFRAARRDLAEPGS